MIRFQKQSSLGRRRALRKNQTEAEAIFWALVRKRRLFGLKFHRQYNIGRYIADFYCHSARLVVEIDGSGHVKNRQKAYDHERDEYMKSLGLRVLRFTNTEVFNEIERVVEKIVLSLPRHSVPPPPPRRG